MKISLKWLIYKGACEEGLEWFQRSYGVQDKQNSKDVVQDLMNQDKDNWAWWLMTTCYDVLIECWEFVTEIDKNIIKESMYFNTVGGHWLFEFRLNLDQHAEILRRLADV
jgi:hypothetical protein